ncbi:hypothetical protein [Actinomadura terrae]|uniref:hypothetical protein n=1 Tax=Actinomadura terrae TaxID=604353 RepID=UPI001FA6BF29|nr:hypothetical protein [Actinomadura terrae]
MNTLRRAVAIVVYCALVPVGVAIRLIADPLRVRRAPARSNWRRVPQEPVSLERARRL